MTSPSFHKKNGFTTITLLLFLPLAALLAFAFGFIGYIVQYKTKMRSTCLNESLKIEKNLIRSEENLFKLNTLARALRLQLKLAYVELAAALASENPVWVAEVQMKISQIKGQQKNLDWLQQNLIRMAKIQIQTETWLLQNKLSQIAKESNSIWSFYLSSFTKVHLTHASEMAVIRDSPEMGPVYELAQDYEARQRLAYQWHHLFQTKSESQTMLSTQKEFDMSCSVSAQKGKTQWTLSINVDKS